MADEEVIRSMPAMAKDEVGLRNDDGEGEKRSSRFMEHEVIDHKEKSGSFELKDAEDGPQRGRGGEPIIRTGADVSKYAVSPHDTHLPSITLRSILLGTAMAALSAALSEIYVFKPVDVGVSGVFLLLFVFALGKLWEFVFPYPNENQPVWIRKFWGVINPRPFGLKEHVVSTLMATTASYGSTAVNNFAVQRLFYDTTQSPSTAILATFSTAMFGYGLVGLLRPLTVYPSEMVYWTNLPYVLTMQTLHKVDAKEGESVKLIGGENNPISKKLKLFWGALGGMAIWEIFPQYIFPLLNGISIPCLASQNAPINTRRTISQVFGGGAGNEGLGILELSFDWQYITSWFLSLPLVQQANSWVGYLICYVAIAGIYYSNTWQSAALPLLSTSIFSNTSTPGVPIRWNQTAVFGRTFSLNETALQEEGLPLFAGSYAWNLMTGNWAIGGLIAHVLLFWGPYLKESVLVYTRRFSPTSHDPASASTPDSSNVSPTSTAFEEDIHYQGMKIYKEAPWWWYTILLALAFFAGLIVVLKGGTTLPVWGYILALIVGSIITPFSNLMIARMGNGVATNQLMKMIAGAVHPGKPVANLYFSMWSHDVIQTAVVLGGDLKVGQYLKIPPRVMFLSQVWGSLIGCFVNYAVMASITRNQREVLLDPQGTNVWSGFVIQSLNSQAVTWSLSSHEFGVHSQYIWIPFGLLFGTIPTIIQWLIWRRYPKIGPIQLDTIIIPIIYQYASYLTLGVNSVILTSIVVGATSQIWIRRYHPRWFRKYMYLLGGALDGGAQIVVFILSFAVFGASGVARPFPTWWGNPAIELNNVDYCVNTNVVPPT